MATLAELWEPESKVKSFTDFPLSRGVTDTHKGMDYAIPLNTPITAATSGIVKYKTNDPKGYGNAVEIVDDKGNVLQRYAHLNKFSVPDGSKIEPGQVLGLSGSTGKSTGPHLHFEDFTAKPIKVSSKTQPKQTGETLADLWDTTPIAAPKNVKTEEKPKSFAEEVKKPFETFGLDEFQKESIIYNIAQLTNPLQAAEATKNLYEKSKNIVTGLGNLIENPKETLVNAYKEITENPGKFVGQTIKGIIYDPETLLPMGAGSKALNVESQLTKQLEAKGARSVGAAEADLPIRIKEAINRASPEKQNILNQLPIEKLTEQDLKTIENHNKFDKFNMTPTEGQALEDISKMSDEFNARKQDPRLQERFEERDPKLIQGFNTINEKVSPDVFEVDPQRLASMPLDKIKKVYDEKEQVVRDLWKRANSASGMAQAPIDIGALQENIINGLREKQRTRYVPPELKADLDDALKQGFLTPEQYENFRTDTALIARTNPNPMARQAAAIIREKLESVPIKDEYAQYKPLYDEARKATTELHQFEKSPIVKSAISDTRTAEELAANMPHPAAKNFMSKHYSATTPQVEIQRLIDLIGKDSVEHQALNKLKIDEFKFNSGVVNNKGTVSQAALNKQIYEQHKTNLPTMLGQEATKDLQDLADVANLTEFKKGIHSVNTSNTEILAEQNRAKQQAKQTAANIGSGIAEANIHAIAPGVGTIGRSFLKGRSEQKALQKERLQKLEESQRRLSPTAGIGTKLQDIGKK